MQVYQKVILLYIFPNNSYEKRNWQDRFNVHIMREEQHQNNFVKSGLPTTILPCN